MQRICVFTGSSQGARHEYHAAAQALGRVLVGHKLGLVYGGGDVGLMGAIADAVLAEHGEVLGVIPDTLMERELGHAGVTKLYIVDSMHTRKARMAELADGFVAMPGGFGTMEELFEVITWAQLGIHAKPIGLLNILGYYDHLLDFMKHMTDEQFVRANHHDILMVENDPGVLLERMVGKQSHRGPASIGNTDILH